MITKLIFFCAIMALLEMDTTYFGQFLIGRPAVAGAVAGVLTGDFFTCLQLGLFTELVYLDFIPIGSVVPPSGCVSVACAAMMLHYFGLPAPFAFFAGIACGIVFSFVDKYLRRARAKILHKAERKIYDGKTTAGAVILKSLLMQYGAVFIFVLGALFLAGPVFSAFLQKMPQNVITAFNFSYFIVPWMGLAVLFVSFGQKPRAD